MSDQEKLASQLGLLGDLVCEASYMGTREGAAVVERVHVEKAKQAGIFRNNRLEEKSTS